MNKLILTLTLATTLMMSLAAPSASADPMIQTLPTAPMSVADFNSLFQPISNAPAITSSYTFNDAPTSGVMQSQVFQGVGAAAGDYAYAYQLGVNNVTDSSGNPVELQSASWKFNATPVGTNFENTANPVYAYTINGSVGSLNLPQAAPGQTVLSPSQITWAPNTNVGSLTASYVDPANGVPALGAGGNSATFVVISKQPFSQQFVNIQSPDPIAAGSPLTTTYAATGGTISPVPAGASIPEPATILLWSGMGGAVLLVRRVRKNRPTIA
jgi:hypothetical protein